MNNDHPIIKKFREKFGYINLVGVERERFDHMCEFLLEVDKQAREETIEELYKAGEIDDYYDPRRAMRNLEEKYLQHQERKGE